jgi:CBS domain-containing protein
MILRDLRNIIKPALPLAADDLVAKAVRLLRARALPALPVAEQGRLVGFVHESDLLEFVADAPDPRAAARTVAVAQVMRPVGLIISDAQPLSEVAQLLRDPAAAAVPVAGPDGRYLGMLLRRDLLAAVSGQPIVPPIAGLATPFGVYLTTGALRSGAGNFALAATGAALMLLNLLANGVVYGLARLADYFLFPGAAQSAPEPPFEVPFVAELIFYGLWSAIFLLLLRFSPLAGTHGAEHMVVHAIEEGEDLDLQKTRSMPRVHPRCGTNLMALLVLLVIALEFFSSLSTRVDEGTRFLALLVLVTIVLLTWRRLGAGLQRWVTTRQPSERQLARALDVGRDLLEKVRLHPGARVSFPRCLWNSSFPQVLSGFLAMVLLVTYSPPLLTAAWTWLKAL